jgi:hypothetical protein
LKEFREFLLKQNAFALAIGVVIGAAVGKVVSGIVDDLVMPIVGVLLPGGDWRNAAPSLGRQRHQVRRSARTAGRFLFHRGRRLCAHQAAAGEGAAGGRDQDVPAMPGDHSRRRAQMPRLRLGGRLIEFAHDG